MSRSMTGDFTNYIRDFIATIGSVFNAVVELVEDGETDSLRGMSRRSSSGCTSATCPSAGHRH